MNFLQLNPHIRGQVLGSLGFADLKCISLLDRETRLAWSNHCAQTGRLCWTSSAEQLPDLVAVLQNLKEYSPQVESIRLQGAANLGPNSAAVIASACPNLTTFKIDQPSGLRLEIVLDLLNHFPHLKQLDLTAALAMHFVNEASQRTYPGIEAVKLNEDPDVAYLSGQQLVNLKSWFPNIVDYGDLEYSRADVLMRAP